MPRNLNYWWTFGGILTFMLVVQIVTGIVLAMHYVAHAGYAFDSVENIMRDVNYGWLLRYMHSNGASMFFIAVYIHIFRGMYYGSYKAPREVLWILGVIIFLLMMATAFMGYVLPWGQMSFWGATVITNLFSAIPLVGNSITTWLWGGFSVDNPTLNRFFSLHYLLPFMIAGVVVLHIWALHVAGQTNPTGDRGQDRSRTRCPSRPTRPSRTPSRLSLFLIFFSWFVFYIPNYLGHADNYIQANPLQTPAHIVPEWYFLPFYAILRAIPNKLARRRAPCSARSLCCSSCRGSTRRACARPTTGRCTGSSSGSSCVVVIGLGYLGSQPPEGGYVIAARMLTACYFVHFLVSCRCSASSRRRVRARPRSPRRCSAARRWRHRRQAPPRLRRAARGDGQTPNADRHHPARRGSSRRAAARRVGARCRAGAGAATPHYPLQEPKHIGWTFAGPFGKYDPQQLQRGFQIYHEVCSACHSLSMVAFRDLASTTGPHFTPDEVKALAAETTVADASVESGSRPGRPYSRLFPAGAADSPARHPPDLSLIAKARAVERGFPNFIFDAITQYQQGGPDYIHSLLTGFQDPPADVKVPDGRYYNPYFNSAPVSGDASAALRRPGQLRAEPGRERRKRRSGDRRPVFQGRHGIPDVGGRAAPRRAQVDGADSDGLPRHLCLPRLLYEEEGLGDDPERGLTSSTRRHQRLARVSRLHSETVPGVRLAAQMLHRHARSLAGRSRHVAQITLRRRIFPAGGASGASPPGWPPDPRFCREKAVGAHRLSR